MGRVFEGAVGVKGLSAVPELGQVFGEVGFGRNAPSKYYADNYGNVGDVLNPLNDVFYSGTGWCKVCLIVNIIEKSRRGEGGVL
jgi:hypothetical protein